MTRWNVPEPERIAAVERARLVARRTFRIGVETLYFEEDADRWWSELRNRSYHSIVPVPPERVGVLLTRLHWLT